ncbi:NAD(P)-dependent dehydrogenase, short-chain alcohol dehydrogenase family [Chryseobacterium oranimense]|uniref:NAD(P)-dependent dehydrogenase, short-chain alcohol dehydrogenase family n=1 Tax=Chryseobacterium oranimense TaxID=421058 RepID=A0A1M5JGV9_9FLAO|nr:SDR family oxidoreductase [Chryseobacterium oranimense]CEJ69033.1 3-oxoacyl-[acyl-carrier-protein] reductase FabG [Chryseobacterium oranimense G311]SHG39635.1 NAD(P)-dependent dehydrogenase, short-chain alcohol dehydrogenase family [Chryseobacterium oranimense]
MNTKTKIALITGGSRGLGKNAALKIAQKGLDVIITYKNSREEADAVVNEIKALGQKAAAYQLDTRDVKSFDAFVKNITDHLKTETGSPNIDFLVNNAGTALYSPITETTEEQLDDIINVHFKGVFFLTQKMLPFINDGGGIINISSGLARFALPGSSVYGSIKAGVEMLTKYMAKELGSRKIKANVIAPGAIETDFGGGRTRDDQNVNSMISGVTALGRAGLPDDIGGVVAFLCTDDAGWINGQRIEASGGMFL